MIIVVVTELTGRELFFMFDISEHFRRNDGTLFRTNKAVNGTKKIRQLPPGYLMMTGDVFLAFPARTPAGFFVIIITIRLHAVLSGIVLIIDRVWQNGLEA